jgi:nitrite reductase/ring-hydroxylating ferredoxin subunit
MKKIVYCLLLLCAVGCTKVEEARIPYCPVYLELDLTFNDKILTSPNSHKIYSSREYAMDGLGFGGIIVYYSPFGSYLAYDIACPYEVDASIVVSVDESGLYAVCPVCGSKYELTHGYPTKESVSTYRLQPYWVYSYSSSKLIVQHNK